MTQEGCSAGYQPALQSAPSPNVVQGLQPLHARPAGVHACTIPETDTLPDDTRLAPCKPTPPTRPPTVITFRLPEMLKIHNS